MKIILAHDSFTQYGGAERVFDGMHELYPHAPVYTLVISPEMKACYSGWDVLISPLQWVYHWYPKFQHLFPLIPLALRFFRTERADILLSSSSSFIKGIIKPAGAFHVNYCHTPTRFLWVDPEHAYKEIPRVLHPLARMYMWWLKKWDYAKAQQVDYFIANSNEVQKRIKQYYHRDSVIIYPFVDITFWKPTRAKQDYFLIAGRLQYAKGLETVITAFNELGLPLHVVGTGRFEHHLRSMAKSNVTFLGRISDEALRDEYSGARAFIYPQREDFGIMPIEAAACGTPTIGLAAGGTLETVVRGQTGELFEQATSSAITQYVSEWQDDRYTQAALTAHAQQFSKEQFKQQISDYITSIYNEHSH